MNVHTGIWDYLTRIVLFLLFLAGLLLVGIKYLPLINQNENMRKEMLRLDERIQKEEERGKQLRSSIDALRYDPKAVERLARERLGYARPGETIIRFEAPVTNAVTR